MRLSDYCFCDLLYNNTFISDLILDYQNQLATDFTEYYKAPYTFYEENPYMFHENPFLYAKEPYNYNNSQQELINQVSHQECVGSLYDNITEISKNSNKKCSKLESKNEHSPKDKIVIEEIFPEFHYEKYNVENSKMVLFICKETKDENQCNFKSNKIYNFLDHINSHYDIRPYKCKAQNCDESFSQNGNLMRHIVGKHYSEYGYDKHKRFECSECHTLFTAKNSCISHIESRICTGSHSAKVIDHGVNKEFVNKIYSKPQCTKNFYLNMKKKS